jgi:putative ABC transport system permease protein
MKPGDFSLAELLSSPLSLACAVFGLVIVAAGLALAALSPKLLLLMAKNLRRNVLRTILTSAAIMVLVFVVTLIATVLFGMERFTQEKARDLKLIITDRYQLPSQMPGTYVNYLDPESPGFILSKDDVGPNDFMSWSFYGGTLDPAKRTREHMVFFFVMQPKHILPMMDDLGDLDPELVRKLEAKRDGCLLGPERLKAINRKVGERFKLTSMNYKDVDLEFEVVGVLPEGRYSIMGIMRADYFNNALDDYARKKGQPHPLDQKRLNLVWLRVKDRPTFEKVQSQIESASVLQNPPVKCETASSGVASFLDAYRSFLSLMKWVVLFLQIIMALVVANSISISVRERRTEMAVLKVLGFRPGQIVTLVLGEALLVGGLSGLLAAGLTYGLVNYGSGGLPFRIGFIPVFFVPVEAIAWGLAMGLGTGLLGSIVPSWSAQSVRVSDVFAKVT